MNVLDLESSCRQNAACWQVWANRHSYWWRCCQYTSIEAVIASSSAAQSGAVLQE